MIAVQRLQVRARILEGLQVHPSPPLLSPAGRPRPDAGVTKSPGGQ
jgi:hypothetical protein